MTVFGIALIITATSAGLVACCRYEAKTDQTVRMLRKSLLTVRANNELLRADNRDLRSDRSVLCRKLAEMTRHPSVAFEADIAEFAAQLEHEL